MVHSRKPNLYFDIAATFITKAILSRTLNVSNYCMKLKMNEYTTFYAIEIIFPVICIIEKKMLKNK